MKSCEEVTWKQHSVSALAKTVAEDDCGFFFLFVCLLKKNYFILKKCFLFVFVFNFKRKSPDILTLSVSEFEPFQT